MSYLDTKAPLEEIIKLLPKNHQENLLQFLDKTKTKPRWYATNAFNYRYRGKIVYRFGIGENGSWRIFITLAHPNELDNTLLQLSGELRQFFLENLRTCKHCNPAHGDGKRFVILSKEYFGCAEPELEMFNPSAGDIDFLCEYVNVRKANIKRI